MVEIIPSLLTTDITDLYYQIDRLKPYYKHFQIDIVDGEFASHKTNQLSDIINSHPNLSGITIDFDLMVNDYEKALKEVDEIAKFTKIDVVFLHTNALQNKPLPMSGKYSIGIAIDPEYVIKELVENYEVKSMSKVQIMTVRPGMQGEPFIKDMLYKIDQLRDMDYRNKIYIDGAINKETLPLLLYRLQKPDILCPGSYFSHAENVEGQVKIVNEFLKNI